MSVTRSRAVWRVREMLRDMDYSDSLASDYVYIDVVERNARSIAGRVFLPLLSVQSTSLTAGTYEYTLTDTQVQSITQVILNSNGQELVFVPWEQFNAHWKQDSATPVSSGTPTEYTWREIASTGLGINDAVIRVGATPSADDTIDIYRANAVPSATTPAPSQQFTMTDSTAIPFADDLMAGLYAACAGEIAATSAPEALAKRGLSPNCAGVWLAQVTPAIVTYNRRMRHAAELPYISRAGRPRALAARR